MRHHKHESSLVGQVIYRVYNPPISFTKFWKDMFNNPKEYNKNISSVEITIDW